MRLQIFDAIVPFGAVALGNVGFDEPIHRSLMRRQRAPELASILVGRDVRALRQAGPRRQPAQARVHCGRRWQPFDLAPQRDEEQRHAREQYGDHTATDRQTTQPLGAQALLQRAPAGLQVALRAVHQALQLQQIAHVLIAAAGQVAEVGDAVRGLGVAGSSRPCRRAGVGGRRRLEALPAKSGEIDFGPAMRDALAHDVHARLGVERATGISLHPARRDVQRAQQHNHRCREVVAIPALAIEQKIIDPIAVLGRRGPRFVVGQPAQVALDRQRLVVGVGRPGLGNDLARFGPGAFGHRGRQIQVMISHPGGVIRAGLAQALLVGGRDQRGDGVGAWLAERQLGIDRRGLVEVRQHLASVVGDEAVLDQDRQFGRQQLAAIDDQVIAAALGQIDRRCHHGAPTGIQMRDGDAWLDRRSRLHRGCDVLRCTGALADRRQPAMAGVLIERHRSPIVVFRRAYSHHDRIAQGAGAADAHVSGGETIPDRARRRFDRAEGVLPAFAHRGERGADRAPDLRHPRAAHIARQHARHQHDQPTEQSSSQHEAPGQEVGVLDHRRAPEPLLLHHVLMDHQQQRCAEKQEEERVGLGPGIGIVDQDHDRVQQDCPPGPAGTKQQPARHIAQRPRQQRYRHDE